MIWGLSLVLSRKSKEASIAGWRSENEGARKCGSQAPPGSEVSSMAKYTNCNPILLPKISDFGLDTWFQ